MSRPTKAQLEEQVADLEVSVADLIVERDDYRQKCYANAQTLLESRKDDEQRDEELAAAKRELDGAQSTAVRLSYEAEIWKLRAENQGLRGELAARHHEADQARVAEENEHLRARCNELFNALHPAAVEDPAFEEAVAAAADGRWEEAGISDQTLPAPGEDPR